MFGLTHIIFNGTPVTEAYMYYTHEYQVTRGKIGNLIA